MPEKKRNWLLKKRTWLGAAVAAGVLIGMNFPDFWKGFGGGGGPNLVGLGPSDGDEAAQFIAGRHRPASLSRPIDETDEPAAPEPPVVRVVIAERAFALRSGESEEPVELDEVVRLVKRAVGDADGIRLRIYRKSSSRPSAESALQKALAEAGIPEDAILWVPATSD